MRLEAGPFRSYAEGIEGKIVALKLASLERIISLDEVNRIDTFASAHVAEATIELALEVRKDASAALSEVLASNILGLVEIEWKGKVFKTFFPLPFEAPFLSEAAKARFLDEVWQFPFFDVVTVFIKPMCCFCPGGPRHARKAHRGAAGGFSCPRSRDGLHLQRQRKVNTISKDVPPHASVQVYGLLRGGALKLERSVVAAHHVEPSSVNSELHQRSAPFFS